MAYAALGVSSGALTYGVLFLAGTVSLRLILATLLAFLTA